MRTTILLAAFFSLAACVPKKIPGTEIDDTSATRSVIEVVQKYREAAEGKDVAALFKLAHESFKDDGGSASPEDDLDYSTLQTKLAARMSKVSDLKIDLTVRRIEFDGDEVTARVTYSYQLSFKLPELSSRSQSENDIKQMFLKRVGPQEWKITSGI